MKVIQVDQFTSTGNLEELLFSSITLNDISGGDSQAAKIIFGGSFSLLEVSENDSPRVGYVWFKEDINGKCKRYKANYDTSD
jgi:hypothetical protein